MIVPALSDTQLYGQKERYSHRQLYSLSCSSLSKLLHFFWSLLGVGFLLSWHFSGTLQRSSLLSAILFCPLHIFCPPYTFYETEIRNEFWKSYSNQVGLLSSYITTKEHLPCLFRANTWDLFPQNASISDIMLSCVFLMQTWSDETISSSLIGHHPTMFWEREAPTEDKDGLYVCAQTHSSTTDNYTSADDKVLWFKILSFIKWTFQLCLGSSMCVSIMSKLLSPFQRQLRKILLQLINKVWHLI